VLLDNIQRLQWLELDEKGINLANFESRSQNFGQASVLLQKRFYGLTYARLLWMTRLFND